MSVSPAFLNIAKYVENKKYDKAIQLGLKLLNDNTSNTSMVCINLMVAYVKTKDDANAFKYAKLAILNNHFTGLAFERLSIILEKERKYGAAIQICNLVLHLNFYFSLYSDNVGTKNKFKVRRQRLIKKNQQIQDTSVVFTKEELDCIIENSYKSYVSEIQERNSNIKKYGWKEKESDIPFWLDY